mgnify:CR=1 FL=1
MKTFKQHISESGVKTAAAVGTTVDGKYIYDTLELKQNETVVRTNHGILITAGYTPDYETDDEELKARMKRSYQSSVARMKRAEKDLQKVTEPEKMLDAISYVIGDDLQMNPVRMSPTHGKKILVTTGQLMCNPAIKTLYYRPVWCNVEIDNDRLDSFKTNTYFQLLSSREFRDKCLSFKEFVEMAGAQ